MKNNFKILILLAISVCCLVQCNKKDSFKGATVNDYMDLAAGRYVTYRLDSLKYLNFGQADTIISYQAKDIVDSLLTDNLGRPTWRVKRFLNDTAALGTWVPDITYYVTPTNISLEVIENNLRFVKLGVPIMNNFSWKGNSYINTIQPANPNETDYSYLDGWNYTYAAVGETYNLNSVAIPNTITINQDDEILGTLGDITSYSEKRYGQEVYAKGIGMIYKNLIHWIFQPRTDLYPNGYYDGFAISMRMIDHN